ncbi:ATP-dependent DNA helicase [bacterium]|nr:MAG: ATP-dependent DNA helicase [bacterium]
MGASAMVERAFRRLWTRPGYVERSDQLQLALLICDMIGSSTPSAFEAPTGLGKSLAALLPALAHATLSERRIAISTYTNVLAEQYWTKDLPLALSLMEEEAPEASTARFLIGRSRYVCKAALQGQPDSIQHAVAMTERGTETEFRRLSPVQGREASTLWSLIQVPPVCPARACPFYDECYYYGARRSVENAKVVITNHSVLVTHGIMSSVDEEAKGLLGKLDHIIVDEAHDFAGAAQNGLEFDVNVRALGTAISIAARTSLNLPQMESAYDRLKNGLESVSRRLEARSLELPEGILTAVPQEVMDHPAVMSLKSEVALPAAVATVEEIEKAVERFLDAAELRLAGADMAAIDSTRNYIRWLNDFRDSCGRVFHPEGVAVSYVGPDGDGSRIRLDTVGLAEPLKRILWDRIPSILMSATLAVDNEFGFLERMTGFHAEYSEIMPSPFDHARDSCLYLPTRGKIPDPSQARADKSEPTYWSAVAGELTEVIETLGGGVLALFHSRREMEEVARRMRLPQSLKLFVQPKAGALATGERFKSEMNASLFGLRSFWTGFDAPGNTLRCVVLVRIPFEVPIDPPQLTRLAWMSTQGMDPFREHTLPTAKMTMRQGMGRLLRRAGDQGIVAILDPRLHTKRYGEEILLNFPEDMRRFNDLADAMGYLGMEQSPASFSKAGDQTGRKPIRG